MQRFAILMKAGSDSDNILVRAPIQEPFSDTKRKWKHNTEKKQHKLQKICFTEFALMI